MFRCILLVLFVVVISSANAIEITTNLDSVPSEMLGRFVVIVGNVSKYEQNKAIRLVTVERVIYGPNVATGTRTPVKFNPNRDIVNEGTYILLLMYDNDTLIWGYNRVRIGQITDICPVKTANDPEVFDVQVMIDTATIRVPGVKLQRLREIAVRMSNRPFVLQYTIESQMSTRNDIVRETDSFLLNILSHPENNTISTIILADRLLSNTESSQWSESPQRKLLFAQLDKEVYSNDKARTYIDDILRALASKEKESTLTNGRK